MIGPDGNPASGIPAALEIHAGRQFVHQREAVTNTEGSVEWSDVPATAGNRARVGADLGDIRYHSESVALMDDVPASLTVRLLRPVSEGRPLHIDSLLIVVHVEEPGLYRVLQYANISNAGAAAFAGGPVLQNGERAGLELPVPMAATGVEPAPFPNPREALRADTAVILSGRVLDPRPVPPSGRQVAISYNLVTNGDGVLVELELPYPAANVNLLVGGSGSGLVEVSDLNLEPQPPQAIGEAGDQDLYATWGRPSWQPGETIRFRVGPRHSRLAASSWGLLGLGLGLIFAAVGSWTDRGFQRVPQERRQEVLAAVAALDVSHSRGDIGDADYFHRRGIELGRLLLLEQDDPRAPQASE